MTRKRNIAILLVVSAVALVIPGPAAPAQSDPQPLFGNRPIADALVKLDTHASFVNGCSRNIRIIDAPSGVPHLEIDRSGVTDIPMTGTWFSDPADAEFPFSELVASWNVATPSDTGVRFFVRARDASTREWSPWLYTGQWGRTLSGNQTVRFAGGLVDIDTLRLRQPASAWQIRAELDDFRPLGPERGPDVTTDGPWVRRMAVVYSGAARDGKASEGAASAERSTRDREPVSRGGVDVAVPYRTQMNMPPALRSQICSPTSVSMVLEYWGVDRPTIENCRAIWDSDNHLYGNWNRAAARAGEVGLDAWVTRFRDWDQVRAELDAGRPVVASIQFRKGEFPSNVLESTEGHLIVVRGMTAAGDIICNDPASKNHGNAVVYKADELARAWFQKTGVGYVIHGSR